MTELEPQEQNQQEQEQKEKRPRSRNNRLTNEQMSTLKRLQARPKKTILIPEDPLNPDDLVVTVSVNGVTYAIPRGREFEVPDVIYNIWKESDAKTRAAQRRIVMRENLELQIRK